MALSIEDLNQVGEKYKEQAIRQLREPLLRKAYDAYKIAVCYGEIQETAEEHQKMLEWAQKLRDKDITAFYEIPEKVKYYL